MLILAAEFQNVSYFKMLNHVADVLSNFTFQYSESLVWLEDYPNFLKCYLQAEFWNKIPAYIKKTYCMDLDLVLSWTGGNYL